ncbi:MAG: hypothetical protein GY814_03325 [Gammaproteobacteria bacterium]|nr:hypothetical protein [Gammaproteobacteria bacterium]
MSNVFIKIFFLFLSVFVFNYVLAFDGSGESTGAELTSQGWKEQARIERLKRYRDRGDMYRAARLAYSAAKEVGTTPSLSHRLLAEVMGESYHETRELIQSCKSASIKPSTIRGVLNKDFCADNVSPEDRVGTLRKQIAYFDYGGNIITKTTPSCVIFSEKQEQMFGDELTGGKRVIQLSATEYLIIRPTEQYRGGVRGQLEIFDCKAHEGRVLRLFDDISAVRAFAIEDGNVLYVQQFWQDGSDAYTSVLGTVDLTHQFKAPIVKSKFKQRLIHGSEELRGRQLRAVIKSTAITDRFQQDYRAICSTANQFGGVPCWSLFKNGFEENIPIDIDSSICDQLGGNRATLYMTIGDQKIPTDLSCEQSVHIVPEHAFFLPDGRHLVMVTGADCDSTQFHLFNLVGDRNNMVVKHLNVFNEGFSYHPALALIVVANEERVEVMNMQMQIVRSYSGLNSVHGPLSSYMAFTEDGDWLVLGDYEPELAVAFFPFGRELEKVFEDAVLTRTKY